MRVRKVKTKCPEETARSAESVLNLPVQSAGELSVMLSSRVRKPTITHETAGRRRSHAPVNDRRTFERRYAAGPSALPPTIISVDHLYTAVRRLLLLPCAGNAAAAAAANDELRHFTAGCATCVVHAPTCAADIRRSINFGCQRRSARLTCVCLNSPATMSRERPQY